MASSSLINDLIASSWIRNLRAAQNEGGGFWREMEAAKAKVNMSRAR
jgi:hypothetical protein